ncbi:uncharacterized protein BJ212DRAFT_71139 [Suillus subaureus]|uniref:Uncharacterized protein n=1 Tax=Suillus subaureus TaxID=48587 RepID=A0A9P7EEK3_9AGAM|nr:uncharacterized protein BJ212DRAFT_71139 [Suillus subaureus]KAG1819066.1 hypothetical protein BJ212DRAFT_71139 [Suillus subaureus]
MGEFEQLRHVMGTIAEDGCIIRAILYLLLLTIARHASCATYLHCQWLHNVVGCKVQYGRSAQAPDYINQVFIQYHVTNKQISRLRLLSLRPPPCLPGPRTIVDHHHVAASDHPMLTKVFRVMKTTCGILDLQNEPRVVHRFTENHFTILVYSICRFRSFHPFSSFHWDFYALCPHTTEHANRRQGTRSSYSPLELAPTGGYM